MKILLIEDKAKHIEAAKLTLASHELTIATTADEAFHYLEPIPNYELLHSLKARYNCEAGFPKDAHHCREEYRADKDKLAAIAKRAHDEAFPKWEFEAVLTDMLMPNSDRAGGNRKLLDKESAYGLTFIWRAVACGAKYVGLLTDMDHHQHTMSAALDSFPRDRVFKVDNAKVVICREHSEHGKDWGKVLEILTNS